MGQTREQKIVPSITLLRSRFADFSVAKFEQRKLEIEKEAVARYTRGNIPAQRGHYTTRGELDAMRDKIEADLIADGILPRASV